MTKPSEFPNTAFEEGYRRGRDGKGSSAGLLEGVFDTPQKQRQRNSGYQQGRKDRLRRGK